MINKEQIDIELKNTFWNDAALYGLILGVALSLVYGISALIEPTPTAQSQYYTSVITYITMASLLSIFSKIRREKHQNTGYSFSKCLSFILAIMLFTGIIVGTFTYIQIQYISPEYYKQLIDLSSQQIKEMGYAISEEQMAQFDQLFIVFG